MLVAVDISSTDPNKAGYTCGHCGIYVGDGKVAHCPGVTVRFDSLDEWIERFDPLGRAKWGHLPLTSQDRRDIDAQLLDFYGRLVVLAQAILMNPAHDGYIRFRTARANALFPSRPTHTGAWGDGGVYCFEFFVPRPGKTLLQFTVCDASLDKAARRTLKKIEKDDGHAWQHDLFHKARLGEGASANDIDIEAAFEFPNVAPQG